MATTAPLTPLFVEGDYRAGSTVPVVTIRSARRRHADRALRLSIAALGLSVALATASAGPAVARRVARVTSKPVRAKSSASATARYRAQQAADAAETLRRRTDRVTVVAPRGIPASLSAAAIAAAVQVGARATLIEGGTLDLDAHLRLGLLLWTAPLVGEVPMVTPMSTQAVDPVAATSLYGPLVGATLAAGNAVLSGSSARQRAASVGDVLQFVDWRGAPLTIAVGAIVPDQKAGNSEILIPDAVAEDAGSLRPQSVAIWDISKRAKLDSALVSHLRVFERVQPLRVRRSWDPPDVDSVLSTVRLKRLLGEFGIVRSGDALSIDEAWKTANIVREPLPLIGPVTCNRTVLAAARSTLLEIQRLDLAELIDGADSRRNGGCFGAREIRTNVGTSGHDLSRHAWGAALDINPSTNRFGSKPTMDPRIVDVFRRHGFAWGGSFMIPDGMHFEYIGEPRLELLPLPPVTVSTVADPIPTAVPASIARSTPTTSVPRSVPASDSALPITSPGPASTVGASVSAAVTVRLPAVAAATSVAPPVPASVTPSAPESVAAPAP